MRAQPAKARKWVCDHCGNTVPPAYAHKCLEYDRANETPTAGDILYLWPSKNLREIAERIESQAIEDAARTGRGVLGFRHDSNIRDIEAAFNVAFHLRRIAASGIETAKPLRRETGSARKGESPTVEDGDAQTIASRNPK